MKMSVKNGLAAIFKPRQALTYDRGLLVLRIGIGVMFILHGLPKMSGGPETWLKLGGSLSALGIHFLPTFMGFMAALSECAGGLLLALGLFTRSASFFLLCTMIVAATMHISAGKPFVVYSHAVEAAILFLSLLFIGPGKLSLDHWLSSRSK